MFKSIVDRLTGKGKASLPKWAEELVRRLGPLDSLEKGLSERAVLYILTDEDRPVLNALDAQSEAFLGKMDMMVQDDYRMTIYPEPGAKIPPDPRTLLQAAFSDAIKVADGDPACLARIIEVGSRTLWFSRWGVNGFKSSGLPIRVINFFASNNKVWTDHFETVFAAVKLLNVLPYQLLIAQFNTLYYSIAYGHPDQPWLDNQTVEDVQKALAVMTAQGRQGLLAAWLDTKQEPQGDSLDLLIEQIQDGSAKVREQARKLLVKKNDPRTMGRVVEALASGTTGIRSAAVQFLGEVGSPEAMAALVARDEVEKTASVKKLIAQFIEAAGPAKAEAVEGGYLATNGQVVRAPELVVLKDTDAAPFDEADATTLRTLAEAALVKEMAYYSDNKLWGYKPTKPKLLDWKSVLNFANGKASATGLPNGYAMGSLQSWVRQALTRMPPARVLHLTGLRRGGFLGYHIQVEVATDWLTDQFETGAFDLRSIFRWLDAEAVADDRHVPVSAAESLSEERFRRHMTGGWLFGYGMHTNTMPNRAVWPWVFEHMAILPEYLPPRSINAQQNLLALELIATLPAVPQSLVAPLLNACTAPQRMVRRAAQALLADVPGVEAPLVEMLSDSRQDLRASAASYLGQRRATSALPDVLARLKKEKSETARAALITAVAALGGDTGPWLGRKALESEAEANATKLTADKLSWLSRDLAPQLQWADGTPTPPALAEGWLRLALKLKSPADGAGLLGQYLDQLRPQDAQAFGTWVLESWITYDSYQRPYSEVFAEKLIEVRQMPSSQRNGPYYRDKTDEELAAEYARYEQGVYPNSGADSRGILALTVRATPARMARTIAAYLKAHGKRVAQAKTLLEVLAAAGSPEAVQVIVATSTRFKQRTVRELAGELVQRIADERDWTPDLLADRSIPSGGIDESGVLELVTGEEAKPYTARLDSTLHLRIFNPEGREVKSLPPGKDENTKEAKALLSAAKATVTAVSKQQASRLYEAMLSERSWALSDWQNDLNQHPIMSRLTERVVWRGLDAEGKALVSFRPTPEGDLFDAAGEDADLTGVARVDLAHGSLLGADQVAAWVEHLKDFEVTPLFPQLSRPVLKPDAEMAKGTEILDRLGWLGEVLRLRSDCARLGYERGPSGDGGSYESFDKLFPSAGLAAEIGFTGTYQDAENHPVAIQALRFVRLKGRAAYRSRAVPLAEVPPLLLSECWNDLHDVSARMGFDPDWAGKAGY